PGVPASSFSDKARRCLSLRVLAPWTAGRPCRIIRRRRSLPDRFMPPATPDIAEVRRLAGRLAPWLLRTPVLRCRNLEARLGRGLSITGKLEFLQRTGTFKPRGALSTMLDLDEQARAAGVTAVSAGNHAVATAFAARALGTSAKVVMTRSANPARIAACRHY